jgi:hypothetical protein
VSPQFTFRGDRRGRIEALERLVDNSTAGRCNTAIMNDSFLRMPCEKPSHRFVEPIRELQRSRQCGQARLGVAGFESTHAHHECEVLARRQLIVERGLFRGVAEGRLGRDRITPRIASRDVDAARIRTLQACD